MLFDISGERNSGRQKDGGQVGQKVIHVIVVLQSFSKSCGRPLVSQFSYLYSIGRNVRWHL